MQRDEFARVAEWMRRQKLELVRTAPEDKLGECTIKPCILCLRDGQHEYSVSPDNYAGSPPGPGGALIWCGILGCDEYFLLTDNGTRILAQRFTAGDNGVDTNGYPIKPPYPSVGAYYYEQRGREVVWKEVFSTQVEDVTPSTYDLWHCFLAGWRICHEVWPGIQEALDKHALEEGQSAQQRIAQEYQGRARFVSTCKGVKGVACSNKAKAGINALMQFIDGEPYKLGDA